MSLRVMGMVWRAKLTSGTVKLVAARLADFADDEGGRVFPSNARVARDCAISDRAVRDAMRALEAIDVLILVAAERPGQHLPREYRFNLDALAALAEAADPAEMAGGTSFRAEVRSGRKDVPGGASDQGEGGSGCPSPGGSTFRPEGASARNVAPKQGEPRSADPLLDPPRNCAADDARDRTSTVGREVLRLIGVADDPRWLGDWGRVAQWLADGADPDLDIYPTVRRVMERRKSQGPPSSLSYFDKPVADAIATRTRPMPEGHPDAQTSRHFTRKPSDSTGNAWADAALDFARSRA